MNEQFSLFDSNSDYFETDIEHFDQKTAVFRVHASLIYKLGESLIADEVTALSELIKNAYDADAMLCSLSIDTGYSEVINDVLCNGKIELVDNGCGMDLQTIVNGWLTLSNSPKKKMKKERRTTPKYHRYPLGDKGLGRLAVQKLGRYMQMITKSAESMVEYTVTIPWGDFLKNTTIDQIPVTIDEKRKENNQSYTKIIIKDLINNELWESADQINILSNNINKIVSPFRSRENNFKVVAIVNGQTIEQIDKIFEELLSRARARHAISYQNGKSIIKSYYNTAFFYNREMIKRIINSEFSLNQTALDDFWKSSKNKLSSFSFHPNEKSIFVSEDFYLVDEFQYGEKNSGTEDIKKDPGSFDCEIYEYTLDNTFLDSFYNLISFTDLIDKNEYKEFISRFHGIKVVRDGFVVQGFGEGDGGDWLGLSSSSKTTGQYFDLRNDSVIGCVYLTGDKNATLKETTNREGFVEDGYFKMFKQILTESIKRINKNRNKINSEMRTYVLHAAEISANPDDSRVFEPTIVRMKSQLDFSQKTAATNVAMMEETLSACEAVKLDIDSVPFLQPETVSSFEKIYNNIQMLSNEYAKLLEAQHILSNQVETISYDFEKANTRMQDLFELAGLGMSAEMFSHEFDSSIRGIRTKNNTYITNFKNLTIEDFVKHIHYINTSLEVLRKQMSYFNPGLKFVRSEKQTFSFEKFIKEHRDFYNERCEIDNIVYDISIDNDFSITANKGMLNQVFDNLFNNSEYWLDFSCKKDSTMQKKFIVESKERGIVVVYDTGVGISPDIENRLFEPFETKKEKGRGLGLYIVASNLRYHSARIRLLNERNKHGNLFKFEIDLSTTLS